MREREVVIHNQAGIHCRPSGVILRAIQEEFPHHAVTVRRSDGEESAVNSILSLMAQLTGGIGSAESDTMSGVWKALNRYLFDIQRYFPQVAYNEAARIRYEFPAMLGFLGRDTIDPLTQSMGDQLESELQFMNRRLVYMASYAVFGEFLPAQSHARNGLTGLADAGASMAFNAKALPDGVTTPTYTFHV